MRHICTLVLLLLVSLTFPAVAQQQNIKRINQLRSNILDLKNESDFYSQEAKLHPGPVGEKLQDLCGNLKQAIDVREELIKNLQAGSITTEEQIKKFRQEKFQPVNKHIQGTREDLKGMGYTNLWVKKEKEEDKDPTNPDKEKNSQKPEQTIIEDVHVLNPQDFEKWLRENSPPANPSPSNSQR